MILILDADGDIIDKDRNEKDILYFSESKLEYNLEYLQNNYGYNVSMMQVEEPRVLMEYLWLQCIYDARLLTI